MGAIIGSSLALMVDSLVFHPVWKSEAEPDHRRVESMPPPQAQPTLPPIRELYSSPTPSAVPAPMPMPNLMRHDAIRRLRVLELEPSAAGLAHAVLTGGTYAISLFLRAGVGPDSIDEAGNPVLLLACARGELPVVEQLLEAGADPNASNPLKRDGRTALMVAAERGNIPVMDCLSFHCADLSAADAHGLTTLCYAIFSKSAPAVRWLLGRGVSAAGESCDGGGCALQYAMYTWDPDIIEPVLKSERRAHPVPWSRAARDVLYAAIQIADRPMLRLLLSNHAEQPTPDGYQQPLLAYMIAWNYSIAFRLLLDCGADPNARIGSPVERALARLVPDEGTRYYVQKEPGMTLLMLAAGMGKIDFVQMLLEHGAKRGLVSGHYRMAAIQFAARAKHPEVMQLLLGKSPRPEDQRIHIDISLGNQRAVLWKDNRIAMTAPISTGRTGFATPSGRFIVTDKEPHRYSTIYKVSMPYFMRLSCGEFGMHAGVVPNYPASHGCIRLPPAAAIAFYRAVDVGTQVNIEP